MQVDAFPHPHRRAPALALVLLVHLGLLVWMQLTRHHPIAVPAETWIELARVPPPAPVHAPAPPAPARVRAPAAPAARAAVTAPAATQASAPPVATPPPALVAPALPTPSLADRVRAAAGQVDHELRGGKVPQFSAGSTPESRLAAAIAAAQAPPGVFEAPRITEVTDPNGYGRRKYIVETKFGKYCILVESNHAVDGIDVMQKGIKQKVGQCNEF
ncbi:MAG: hypothetical protein ACXU8N_13915 [Telluria sp.]